MDYKKKMKILKDILNKSVENIKDKSKVWDKTIH